MILLIGAGTQNGPIPATFEIGQPVYFARLIGDTSAERRYIGKCGIIVGMEQPWLLNVRFNDNEVHPFNWNCFDQ